MGDHHAGFERAHRLSSATFADRVRIWIPGQDRQVEIVTSGASDEAANDGLHEELAEARAEQSATAAIVAAIGNPGVSLEHTLLLLIRSAVDLCGAERGVIWIRQNDRFVLGTNVGHPAEWVDDARSRPLAPEETAPTVTGRVAFTGEVSNVADLQNDPRFMSYGPHHLGDDRGSLSAPLMRSGSVVGVIGVTRSQPGLFSDRQVGLIRRFADQAVIAIENARLVSQLEARAFDLEQALDQQTATADVLQVIGRSAFDLDAVLKTLIDTAVRLCRGNRGTIFLKRGSMIEARAFHSNVPPALREYILAHPRPIESDHFLSETVRDGKVIHLRNLVAEPSPIPQTERALAAFGSLVCVPLLRDGQAIGCFAVPRDQPDPFTEREINLVKSFADQAMIALENARLFNEVAARTSDLQEALDRQTATADVLRVISRSTFDLRSVLTSLTKTAQRLCRAEQAGFFLREGEVYRSHAGFFENPAFREIEERSELRPGRGSIVGRAALELRTIRMDDAWTDPEYELKDEAKIGGLRSMMAIPLLRSGECIGVFTLGRSRVEPFLDRDVEISSVYADQAVIALENARLFDQVQAKTHALTEALEQQTATSNVLGVISRSPSDLRPVLDAIAETAAQLCGSEQTMFFRYDGEVFRILASWNFPPDVQAMLEQRPLSPGHPSAIGRAGATLEPVCIPDVLADPEYGLGREQSRARYRATLAVPMLREGRLVGALSLNRSEPGSFTDKQIALVSTFADQAVIAIENVRLFEEVQARTRDLQESLEIQTALSDVLGVISRSPSDLKPVLDSIAKTAGRICMASHAHIYMLEDGAYRLTSSTSSLDDPWHSFISGITISPDMLGSATARAARLLQTIHVPDTSSDPEHDQGMFKDQTPRTVISVPLVRDGSAVGVITLNRETIDPFRPRQIELLTSFADQAVIAIRNAQLFDEVQARTAQLSASLDDLREAQDRLVQTEKLASLGQLTAGIAHEIKNPLNFVNNFSVLSLELVDELREVLGPVPLEGGVRTEVEEISGMLKGNLEKVTSHGKRADSIVRNMLLHSRSGSGERRYVDVNSLVEESLNLAYHGARAETPGFNVTLQRDYDAAVGEADLLPQEITRVLLNLMSNGIYAVRKRAERAEVGYEPSLTVVTSSAGETIEIRVRDNGTGIPDDVKQKMFDPFFTTKPAGEGTGLGLSLSHDIIVKQHEGRIDVATEPNAFTEFTIRLPRASGSGRHVSQK
ncbi:MAG: GAF domain-containing protein [Alsobacter sp.]